MDILRSLAAYLLIDFLLLGTNHLTKTLPVMLHYELKVPNNIAVGIKLTQLLTFLIFFLFIIFLYHVNLSTQHTHSQSHTYTHTYTKARMHTGGKPQDLP